jgi:GT2 family glycosyltransferase
MIGVVVLQYGRWRDTIACLQSLAPAVEQGLARIIVVDNASPDDSVDQLERWIRGDHTPLARPVHDTVAAHWWPLSGAPASWAMRTAPDNAPREPQHTRAAEPWTLIAAQTNRGFAAGMNHGIRLALDDPTVDAVWLLNNDTVVAPDAIAAARRAIDASPPETGQWGTTVCYYDRPTIVQSIGWCRWNAWLATSHRVHDGASLAQPLSREVRHPGYVYGASWILNASALREVGLLSEEGFLYGEELDWSRRAAPRWQSRLIADAVVWHREGATVGAGLASARSRSEFADLCGISARLRVSHRFFPARLPTVYSSVLGAVLNRARRGDFRRALRLARLVMRAGRPAPWPVIPSASHSSSSS